MSSSAAAAAASAKTSKEPQQTAHQPKTKYAFDVAKPMKNGFLKKPGKVTKSMKERFFVLYPNFLVYYEGSDKWGFDRTVGNLGNRKGAVKLTKATARAATTEEEAGGNYKYPFVIKAPDQTNEKNFYILDTTSAEERKGWIEAITNNSKSEA